MSFLTPFIEIIPMGTPNTNDFPINIKMTIGKLKDEINVEALIPHLYTNQTFVDYVNSTNYKFIPHMNYYNHEVAIYFDIYGGTYNVMVDDIEYTIKIYFYKIKQPELLTKEIIEKFKYIFRYDYFVKNNILNVSWHEYSLKKYFVDNLNKYEMMDLTFATPSYCKTQLFNHQKNNLARMFNIHSNPTIISITDNMPIFFENELIFDMVKNEFISQSDIPAFSITSGMILDEPGTGKTLQFILYLLEIKLRALIVVPNDSIRTVWLGEFFKHIGLPFAFDILTFDELNQTTDDYLNQYQVIGIDEIHQLYKHKFSLFNKIIQSKIKYRWGITGTPFVSNTSLFHIIKFLTGHIFNNERIAHNPLYQEQFKKFFLKNNKTDMVEYEWPEIIMNDVYVKLDVVQQRIYDTERMLNTNSISLRKLVCSINLMCDNNDITTPDELKKFYIERLHKFNKEQEKIMAELKEKLKNVEDNVSTFEPGEYHKRVEHFNKQIQKQQENMTQYKRAFDYCISGMEEISKIFTKKRKADDEMETEQDEENNCSICFCEFTPPISYIKSCGHYYCKSCLDMNMKTYNKNACPMCRKNIEPNAIIDVNELGEINNSSKIHELLNIIKGTKVIIFTQFNSVLTTIQKYLLRNNITSSILAEYTDEQVLLLSSSYNAEGINLSHFDNMIIFEPFEDNVYCKEVEKQLVARIHRIGRHKPVNVFRFITEGTIEEEIYNRVK
jgi:superfamily II DNA or RNA helicase